MSSVVFFSRKIVKPMGYIAKSKNCGLSNLATVSLSFLLNPLNALPMGHIAKSKNCDVSLSNLATVSLRFLLNPLNAFNTLSVLDV